MKRVVDFHRIFHSGGDGAPTVFPNGLFPEPKTVAVGPGGDIWIAGTLMAPLTLGDQTLAVDVVHVFVARLDPSGNPRWSRSERGYCAGLALDDAGNAIVASKPLAPACAATLVKLGPGGDRLWQKHVLPLSGEADDWADLQSAASDRAGGILLAGKLEGVLQAGPTSVSGGMFLARVDARGDALWGAAAGAGAEDEQALVTADAEGNAIVAHTGSKGSPVWLVKIDAAGAVSFTRKLARDGGGNLQLDALATDPKGNILLAGKGSIVFRQGEPTPKKKWIAKLNRSGRGLWNRETPAERVLADGAGDVLCAAGGSVAKLSPDGDSMWKSSAPTTGDVRVTAAAVDGAGRLIYAGGMLGSIDFGDGAEESGKRTALFVAAIGP